NDRDSLFPGFLNFSRNFLCCCRRSPWTVNPEHNCLDSTVCNSPANIFGNLFRSSIAKPCRNVSGKYGTLDVDNSHFFRTPQISSSTETEGNNRNTYHYNSNQSQYYQHVGHQIMFFSLWRWI